MLLMWSELPTSKELMIRRLSDIGPESHFYPLDTQPRICEHLLEVIRRKVCAQIQPNIAKSRQTAENTTGQMRDQYNDS